MRSFSFCRMRNTFRKVGRTKGQSKNPMKMLHNSVAIFHLLIQTTIIINFIHFQIKSETHMNLAIFYHKVVL